MADGVAQGNSHGIRHGVRHGKRRVKGHGSVPGPASGFGGNVAPDMASTAGRRIGAILPGWKAGLLALPVALYPMLHSSTALAQSAPLVDVCSGLSVDLPVLQPVTSGLLSILDPLTSLLNTNIVDPLSGQNIGVSVLDTNGQVVNTGNGCNLATDGVAIDAQTGLSAGGGQLSGLGGSGNGVATAGEVNSIALGNSATTAASAANSVALGLRGTVTATDGVALGRDANVSSTGGVALGSDSVADRAGMNGATEAFSGTAVASTAGAISVGSTGNERQITNVAGGTADTDAVNVRQLRAVNDGLQGQVDTVNNNVSVLQQDVTTISTRVDGISTRVDGMSDSLGGVATALGGGASFDSTTNTFTGPTYTLRGNSYTDVGTALQALNGAIGGAGTMVRWPATIRPALPMRKRRVLMRRPSVMVPAPATPTARRSVPARRRRATTRSSSVPRRTPIHCPASPRRRAVRRNRARHRF